jgi:hypothetical protein
MSTQLARAHTLHERGLHVLPADHPHQPRCIGLHGLLTPCDGERGKHPAVQWKTWAATVTPQMIDIAWAKRGGVANIAVSCGPSSLVVFDGDAAGEVSRWFEAHGITQPDTYTVATGRGEHVYFSWDHTAQRIGCSPKATKDKGFKVDVRGDGGIVIAEGSQHATGAVYTGNGRPVAPLPAEAAEVLLAGSGPDPDPEPAGPIDWEQFGGPVDGKIEFGHRHHALVAYAGRLRKSGLDYQEVEAAFRERWLHCEQPAGQIGEAKFHSAGCPTPVTWEEAQAKLRDVYGRYAAGDPDCEAAADYESSIAQRLASLRIDREARRRLDDETRPPAEPPPVKSLEALVSEPDSVTPYRVDSVAPEGARIMLSAQYKAGKTTLIGNLTRSLVDGQPFLGRFEVNRPACGLVLIDDEMSESAIRGWLRAQNITNTAAVADVVCLRGRVGAFNLLDDRCRATWARRLRDAGCDYLILDCLRPVLDVLGLDEHRDAGRFLVAFDTLLTEADVGDAAVVQHMGHTNERARGDSRLQDWPDAIWRLVRETDEPGSPRYFSAYGRDVAVPEGRLSFDENTRRLTYAGGTRGDAKAEAAMRGVVALLAQADTEGLSGAAIEVAASAEHTRNAIRSGIKLAIKHGHVSVHPGPRNAKLHRIAHPCSRCRLPVSSGGEQHQSCPPNAEGLFDE